MRIPMPNPIGGGDHPSSVQLRWVPRLYYWMKQKYADNPSCNMTHDPNRHQPTSSHHPSPTYFLKDNANNFIYK